MRHGIIFWGNSHHSNSIFKIQKTIRRIITNAGSCDSCHQLYKQLQILSLTSQCIFSLLVFINKKRGLFLSNSEIHDMNTRFNYNLHLPYTHLTLVQKGVLYSGSKIYNHLPLNITILSNDAKHFKSTLKSHLIEHTFYELDVCLSMHRCICIEKKSQLNVIECFIALTICSTCFGHFYAHHQDAA